MIRLSEVERRAWAATEGPWDFDGRDEFFNTPDHDDKSFGIVERGTGDNFVIAEVCGDVPEHRGNAPFIAAARTDVPALAAALRVAVEAVERISNFDCANDNWKACATSCPSCIAGAARARIAENVEVEL